MEFILMLIGSPPMNEADLGPYIIDVPGQRQSLWDRLNFLKITITSLPGLIWNNPHRVNARVQEVGL
jgi:hypothetical protein